MAHSSILLHNIPTHFPHMDEWDDEILPEIAYPDMHFLEDVPTERRELSWILKDKHNSALRYKNEMLSQEVVRLRALLRQHGILDTANEMAVEQEERSLPQLPTEVLLLIMKYALISTHPIVDPFCKLDPKSLTKEEREWGNQVAINMLAASRAFHQEGSKVFWSRNTFCFTRPEALKSFGEADLKIRISVTSVNFRVTAQFFYTRAEALTSKEESKHRMYRLSARYNSSLERSFRPEVQNGPSYDDQSRDNFRTYSWNQLADFLWALRGPWDPDIYIQLPTTRLLPNLQSLRIDLVNFIPCITHYPLIDFHNLTAHEFSHTLQELHLTGFPSEVPHPGSKACAELSGMVKDGGILMMSEAAYLCDHARGMVALGGSSISTRLVRSYKLRPKRETKKKKKKKKQLRSAVHKRLQERLNKKAQRHAEYAVNEENLNMLLACERPVYCHKLREISLIDKIWDSPDRETLLEIAILLNKKMLRYNNPVEPPEDDDEFPPDKYCWRLVPTSRDMLEREWRRFNLKTGYMMLEWDKNDELLIEGMELAEVIDDWVKEMMRPHKEGIIDPFCFTVP